MGGDAYGEEEVISEQTSTFKATNEVDAGRDSARRRRRLRRRRMRRRRRRRGRRREWGGGDKG